jgi:hypothetical protein
MFRQRACGIKQDGSATQRDLHPHAPDASDVDYSNAKAENNKHVIVPASLVMMLMSEIMVWHYLQ